MLATGVMAGFGFIFWLLISKLFSAANIGLATTLISVMNIIALLSLMGFDSAFVRYLPTSNNKNEKINTGLIIVAGMSVLLASIFLFFIERISPSLQFIIESPERKILFVFFCVMTALNILTDSVFLSERKTNYTLIVNTIFSICRILLPYAFLSYGALGIFIAVGVSQSIGLLLSVFVMIYKFQYRPLFIVSKSVLTRIKGYIVSNYVAGIFNLLPATILPIMITNHLGPEQAAFYYIIMMIGNLMYAIPWAATRSLFAEGSHDETKLNQHTFKVIKIVATLLFPVMIVLYFFGDRILLIFGKNYSYEGFAFLKLIALSGIVVAGYSILGAYFRVRKDPRWLIVINLSYAIGIISSSYLLISFGLRGIGYAWILGHVVAIITSIVILFV